MSIDLSSYLEKLSEIYDSIDREYEALQEHYNHFSCEGCDDNCCTTVFFHYTLTEYLFLVEGLEAMDKGRFDFVLQTAKAYQKEFLKNPYEYESLRIMCPLNIEGLCILYKHRPLICRIHGLPGFLESPKKGKQHWSGCLRFRHIHGEDTERAIDRTPFYTQIATLEGQVRRELVFFQKYKKTIAEMIIDFSNDEITHVKRSSPGDFIKENF